MNNQKLARNSHSFVQENETEQFSRWQSPLFLEGRWLAPPNMYVGKIQTKTQNTCFRKFISQKNCDYFRECYFSFHYPIFKYKKIIIQYNLKLIYKNP